MKKIILAMAAAAMSLSLVACSGGSDSGNAVSVTEQNFTPEKEDTGKSPQKSYLSFVNEFGGTYAAFFPDSNLLDMGNTICDGFDAGLSQSDIIQIFAEVLIENDMANDNGTKFASSMIAGAETFLCSSKF